MWIHKDEFDALKKFQEKQEKRWWNQFGMSDLDLAKRAYRRRINPDNRKWAYIIVCNTRKLAWVDNVTMKAYKSDRYNPTWIEIKKFTFERWCTPMDL